MLSMSGLQLDGGLLSSNHFERPTHVSTDFKKTSVLGKAVQNNLFLGVTCLGGSPGKIIPQTMSKYLSVKNLQISKKHWRSRLSHSKIDFRGSPWRVLPPNYVKIFACHLNIY